MIRSALIDWAENPVITSLDSIATPINSMQFPTITVCKDETKEQPDNWAYLEKLLNLLWFQCAYAGPAHPNQNYGNECKNTENLRKDYEFMIDKMIEAYEKWIMKNPKQMNTIEFLLQTSYQKSSNEVINSLKFKEMSYTYLKKLAINYFGKFTIPDDFEYLLVNNSDKKGVESEVNCTTSQCLKNELMTRIFNEMTAKDIPFGTFLREFIQLNEFWSFSQIKSLWELNWELWFAFDEENICDFLSEQETFVHDYFTNLSLVPNFNETESNDLFELPGKLGTLIEKPGDYEPSTFDIKMFQAPFYSMCKQDMSTPFENMTLSSTRIQKFIENPKTGRKLKACFFLKKTPLNNTTTFLLIS